MTRKWAFILAVAGAVAGGATSASATAVPDVTLFFTSCHIQAGCGATPFGEVDLTQVGSDVSVSVHGPNFTFFAQTGAIKGLQGQSNDVIFAFNGTGITAADITNITGTSVSAVTLGGVAGTFSVNGQPDFGTFGFGIECTNCNGTSEQLSAISFTVTGATIAELTAPNAAGVRFIADVLVNGGTGVVDVSVPAPVVGAGLPGLLAACSGLVILGRRRRQKVA